MSRLVRLRVVALLEMASRPQVGTVIIDRDAGLVTVRPFKRRRTYTLPLADIAAFVVRRIILAELREKRRARKAKRKH